MWALQYNAKVGQSLSSVQQTEMIKKKQKKTDIFIELGQKVAVSLLFSEKDSHSLM